MLSLFDRFRTFVTILYDGTLGYSHDMNRHIDKKLVIEKLAGALYEGQITSTGDVFDIMEDIVRISDYSMPDNYMFTFVKSLYHFNIWRMFMGKYMLLNYSALLDVCAVIGNTTSAQYLGNLNNNKVFGLGVIPALASYMAAEGFMFLMFDAHADIIVNLTPAMWYERCSLGSVVVLPERL